MAVSRDELEICLSELRASVSDPRHGLFGPSSVAWRVGRESGLLAGGGRAALLQLAHPFVAHAIVAHSETTTNPRGRFQRTFNNVYKIVFGDLDCAFGAARRVHSTHMKIEGQVGESTGAFRKGTAYEANHDGALFWVHATLVDTALMAYEELIGPLTYAEKDRYYQEMKRFARLFAISYNVMPPTWLEFRPYFDDMVLRVLGVGGAARQIAKAILSPPNMVAAPAYASLELLTSAWLPPTLREAYGLRFGATESAALRVLLSAERAAYSLLPGPLRYIPAYQRAMQRCSGSRVRRRDQMGRRLHRWIVDSLLGSARAAGL